jgi:putative transposase
MSQSLSNMLAHVVFSTKDRQRFLYKEICNELYPYIDKILENNLCYPYKIGGTMDHIHIVFALGRSIAISKLIEEIKTSTSKWIKNKDPVLTKFAWQNGYGIFSISATHLSMLKAYVTNQETHHKVFTFQNEFMQLLKKNNVTYNKQYLWN